MRRICTEVVIETCETYVIKHQRHLVRAWCEDCQKEVSLIPPSEAAILTFQETSAIFFLMDTNRIHFRYLREKTPFICLTSLCLA